MEQPVSTASLQKRAWRALMLHKRGKVSAKTKNRELKQLAKIDQERANALKHLSEAV